jgi:hypothetical protein
MTTEARMNEPSPIRGRWTLWGAGPGFPTMADVRLPSGAQVDVVPVPDEQAIERAAKVLFGESYQSHGRAEVVEEHWPLVSEEVRRFNRNRARTILAAALEQPESPDSDSTASLRSTDAEVSPEAQ